MLWLGSTPSTEPPPPTSAAISQARSPRPRPDVQHVLALPERQSRAYGMTLLDDIARHVCRFGPPRRLLVELEHGAHPTIFSASPRTLNLTGRVMHERMVESSAG